LWRQATRGISLSTRRCEPPSHSLALPHRLSRPSPIPPSLPSSRPIFFLCRLSGTGRLPFRDPWTETFLLFLPFSLPSLPPALPPSLPPLLRSAPSWRSCTPLSRPSWRRRMNSRVRLSSPSFPSSFPSSLPPFLSLLPSLPPSLPLFCPVHSQ